MILIGDNNDHSGNGMFSKSARKLNMLFMNLKDRGKLFPNSFSNKTIRNPISNISANKNKGEESTKKIILKTTKVQPFDSYVSREKLQRLELQKITAPLYGNYNPKIVARKIKILRNYNYENCENKREIRVKEEISPRIDDVMTTFDQGQQMIEQNDQFDKNSKCGNDQTEKMLTENMSRAFRIKCKKFYKEEQNTRHQKPEGEISKKLLGFMDLKKQTARSNFYRQSYFEVDVNPAPVYLRLKKSTSHSKLSFHIGNTQSYVKKSVFQRNSYNFDIKRALVEKRTELKVPNFTKELERRPLSCVNNCNNKGFYDVRFPDCNLRTVNFKKILGRGPNAPFDS